jgi:hypothetical protein
MSKPLLFWICGAALILPNANAADFSAWKSEQHLTVTTPGMVRVDLPPTTLSEARAQLEDLRLLSPSSEEMPFAIQRDLPVPTHLQPVGSLQVQMEDHSTVLQIETGTQNPISALLLESPAPNFIKSAVVEGSKDGQQWSALASNEMIFRQPNGASRLRIPLTPAVWPKLRVTINDQRTSPVPFTGARLELAVQQPVTVSAHASALTTTPQPRETQLTTELGANHLHLASVKLSVTDPVFSRRVRVSYALTENGMNREIAVAAGTIYRIKADDRTAELLEIPIHEQVNASQLILTIENGDNPPLQVTDVEFIRVPITMVFFAKMPGDWRLLTGNPTASAPAYDLQAMQSQLRPGESPALTPGAVTPNPAYQPPTALPGVNPEGATLDLSSWHYRKPVTGAKPGALRVSLDVEILARSQLSLGDLRLIQGGRQVPFVMERSAVNRTLNASVVSDPDKQRPSVSVWRASLPLEGIPAEQVICTSTTPLFERTLEVLNLDADREGGRYRMPLASRHWTRNNSREGNEFHLPLASARLKKDFFIEAENGDNAPIVLKEVRVEYRGADLIAKLSQPSPVFLYYGNSEAGPPRYDLQLARNELMSAPMTEAMLGPEEVLRPQKPLSVEVGAGSPWLWAALALVLVVLLWIVAKMLPAPQKPTS